MDDQRDPARFWARRLSDVYALTLPTTLAELRRVCCEEGIVVETVPELDCPGVYHGGVDPFIALAPDVSAWVLSHELFHHKVADGQPVIHRYSSRGALSEEERAAQRFAWLLCSPTRHAREELGG